MLEGKVSAKSSAGLPQSSSFSVIYLFFIQKLKVWPRPDLKYICMCKVFGSLQYLVKLSGRQSCASAGLPDACHIKEELQSVLPQLCAFVLLCWHSMVAQTRWWSTPVSPGRQFNTSSQSSSFLFSDKLKDEAAARGSCSWSEIEHLM